MVVKVSVTESDIQFTSPRDVVALTQRLIVNCTGYGARSLWSDESLVPVRGQIGWLPPQEGVNYGMALDDLIITARRDGIAVQPTPQGDDTGWTIRARSPIAMQRARGSLRLEIFIVQPRFLKYAALDLG